MNSNNKNELMAFMAKEAITVKSHRGVHHEVHVHELYPIEQNSRKGLDRPDIEKYKNFNLGPYFEDMYGNTEPPGQETELGRSGQACPNKYYFEFYNKPQNP